MQDRVAALMATEVPLVFCGDYNVIPQSLDAAKPEAWVTDALYLPESRAAFRRLLALGLTDAFRARNPAPGQYTFWDYQAGAWERNHGIRIDHHLLSPQAADLLVDCRIDKDVRAGDKPSDHVPIWIDLAA
jgi:exodeoxyribonuclease III